MDAQLAAPPRPIAVSPAGAHALTSIAARDITDACRSGQLPHARVGVKGSRYLIRLDDLDSWVAGLVRQHMDTVRSRLGIEETGR